MSITAELKNSKVMVDLREETIELTINGVTGSFPYSHSTNYAFANKEDRANTIHVLKEIAGILE